MYYDNKTEFYLKQYGAKLGLLVVSLCFVLGASVLYIKDKVLPNTNVTAILFAGSSDVVPNKDSDKIEEVNNTVIDNVEPTATADANIVVKNDALEDSKVEVQEADKSQDNVVVNDQYFENLALMTKSKKCSITSVNDNGSVVVNSNGDTITLKMIGISLNAKNTGTVVSKMKEDLLEKEIRIAFDTSKTEGSEYYAYIYANDELYNASLLKEGITTIRSERTNISLNNILAEAQRYAKTNSKGIWA